MYKIGILIPVCSRNQHYDTFNNTPLMSVFLPNFSNTKNTEYSYKLYIGIDDSDSFYMSHKQDFYAIQGLEVDVCILTKCEHKPTHAWNNLLKVAYEDGCDYFFQIGDDVELKSDRWTEIFINYLLANKNVGITGPCDIENYNMRKSSGKFVIENVFFHRTHFDVFKTLFHPEIDNWYCDNWITDVYTFIGKAKIHLDIICKNNVRDIRYKIMHIDPSKYNKLFNDGIKKLQQYSHTVL